MINFDAVDFSERRSIEVMILWDAQCIRLRSCLFWRQNQRFENADSKRRSKTPLIQAIVRAQVNRKGV